MWGMCAKCGEGMAHVLLVDKVHGLGVTAVTNFNL